MRLYKPAYTKPLPAGVKIKTSRGRANPRVTIQDRDGQTKDCPVVETSKGRRVHVESSYWWIIFADHTGTERRLQAFREKSDSDILMRSVGKLVYHRQQRDSLPAELQTWVDALPENVHAQLADFGLVRRRQLVVSQALEDLLRGFEEFLAVKRERSAQYVFITLSALRRIFAGCGFQKFADIDDVVVEKYLLGLRKEHPVTVKIKGKVITQRRQGLSKRTLNGHVGALQQFCRWCVRKQKVARHNPLDSLEKYDNEHDDCRKIRRALTRGEVQKLLKTTAEGPERFGMDGRERALLYRVAVETGLRANELRTLDVQHADLNHAGGPVLFIDAGYSKHRERDEVPLRPDLAREIQAFIVDRKKLPQAKLFGGRYVALTDKPADMFYADLKAAGIERKTVAGSLDFHALRHTFVSSLKGIEARQAQALARHKSSTMTDRYTHAPLQERRALLNDVPYFGVAG